MEVRSMLHAAAGSLHEECCGDECSCCTCCRRAAVAAELVKLETERLNLVDMEEWKARACRGAR